MITVRVRRMTVSAIRIATLAGLLFVLQAAEPLPAADVAAAVPAAQAACSPRPRVVVNSTNSGTNTLNVTVSVSPTNSGPANAIQRIQFGIARNAAIDLP